MTPVFQCAPYSYLFRTRFILAVSPAQNGGKYRQTCALPSQFKAVSHGPEKYVSREKRLHGPLATFFFREMRAGLNPSPEPNPEDSVTSECSGPRFERILAQSSLIFTFGSNIYIYTHENIHVLERRVKADEDRVFRYTYLMLGMIGGFLNLPKMPPAQKITEEIEGF